MLTFQGLERRDKCAMVQEMIQKNQEVSGIVTRKLNSADKAAVFAAVCMGDTNRY